MNKKGQDDIGIALMIILIVGGCVCVCVYCLINLFNGIPIDKNSLTSDYVKEVYPEFKNCSIIYRWDCKDENDYNKECAKIYCNKNIENRDSLLLSNEDIKPTYTFIFNSNLTIDKIKTYLELKESVKK